MLVDHTLYIYIYIGKQLLVKSILENASLIDYKYAGNEISIVSGYCELLSSNHYNIRVFACIVRFFVVLCCINHTETLNSLETIISLNIRDISNSIRDICINHKETLNSLETIISLNIRDISNSIRDICNKSQRDTEFLRDNNIFKY